MTEDILCGRWTQGLVQLLHQLDLGIILEGTLRRLLELARTVLGGKGAKHLDNRRRRRREEGDEERESYRHKEWKGLI